MDKLELKHLAPYLPYGLKGVSRSGTVFNLGVHSNMRGRGIETRSIDVWISEEYKPILRPLSDKKKHFDQYIKQHWSSFEYYCECILDGEISYSEMEELIANHYDVFGLLDAGLAISYKEVGL